MEQKTVFLSYRRAMSRYIARSIYQDLKAHGWDVFLDVNTIDSGDFDRIILNQIAARAHFILLISPDSLRRCASPGDWVLREIQEAVRLERNIVPLIEEGADFAREIGYLPEDLRAVVSKKNAIRLLDDYFEAGMDKLRTRFLKTPEYVRVTEVPAEERAEVQRRMAVIDGTMPPPPAPIVSTPTPEPITQQPTEDTPKDASSEKKQTTMSLYQRIMDTTSKKKQSVRDILPPPFEWIEIPGGRGTMKTSDPSVTLTIPSQKYWMSKYPITNAQFAKFIEAGGYQQQKWWTQAGWDAKAKGWAWNDSRSAWEKTGKAWTEPRYWYDGEWNSAEQPVVGVSWYEAMAFCLWLSDVTGENIMLPTEAQWQYAAQGSDGREYPWGDTFDQNRCNTNESGILKTTPVRWFEGKGDSPFGVVDMAGNVWEWCLNDYQNPQIDPSKVDIGSAARRVLRGGSWLNLRLNARAAARSSRYPFYRDDYFGFRLCVAPSL